MDPLARLDTVVNFEIKELGNHTLVCTISYGPASESGLVTFQKVRFVVLLSPCHPDLPPVLQISRHESPLGEDQSTFASTSPSVVAFKARHGVSRGPDTEFDARIAIVRTIAV